MLTKQNYREYMLNERQAHKAGFTEIKEGFTYYIQIPDKPEEPVYVGYYNKNTAEHFERILDGGFSIAMNL